MSKMQVEAVVIGDSGCGKSSLVHRLLSGRYKRGDKEDEFTTAYTDIDIEAGRVSLTIINTGGSNMYSGLRMVSCKRADVVIICYSVQNRSSLENVVEKWRPEIVENCPEHIPPIVLAGLQSDLRSQEKELGGNGRSEKNSGFVTKMEGQGMMEKINAVTVVECSAKTGEKIRDLFMIAASAGLKYKKEKRKGACVIS